MNGINLLSVSLNNNLFNLRIVYTHATTRFIARSCHVELKICNLADKF